MARTHAFPKFSLGPIRAPLDSSSPYSGALVRRVLGSRREDMGMGSLVEWIAFCLITFIILLIWGIT